MSSDPNRVLFVAPEVTRDTALTFRVTRRTASGATDTDECSCWSKTTRRRRRIRAAACRSCSATCTYHARIRIERAVHLRVCSCAAPTKPICNTPAASTNLCPLSTLPFLHQTTAGAVPTVDQIMDRVVVSHDWMGETFEQLLRTQASQDMLRLFNGVTAIVIGAQVRPSFYYALTGAIYLDAENFWLTAAQRDVINEAPDFRSDFDRDLMYSGVWRYTQNNQNIFRSVSRDVENFTRYFLSARRSGLAALSRARARIGLPACLRSALR